MLKRDVLFFATACLLAASFARAELAFETPANLGAGITDNAYNGTLASMTCVSIPVAGTGMYPVDALAVTAWLDHTWIGDLVFKVISPNGTLVTVMSRPGLVEATDDGTSAGGDSSNLVSTHSIEFIDGGPKSAESMGDGLTTSQAVCRDDGACAYDPNRGAASGGKLNAFGGQLAAGTWKFCAGDAGSGDVGAIQKVRLTFAGATPALLQLDTNTLDFGALVQDTTSGVRFLTLFNAGTMQLSVNSLTNALPPFQRTTDGTCGNSLPHVIAGGSECTLSYAFSPTTQDAASQSFTITSDAAGDSGFTLQGSGDAVFADGFEP